MLPRFHKINKVYMHNDKHQDIKHVGQTFDDDSKNLLNLLN